MKGDPPKMEFIYQKLCICSYMFKLQSPSMYSPFDAVYLLRPFFPMAQNSFWICWFWCLLVFLPFFVSPLPPWQNISLWGLFSPRKTKKGHLGQDQMNKEGGAEGLCHFWSKTTEHSGWGGYACKSPVMKWAHTSKESSKQFTQA